MTDRKHDTIVFLLERYEDALMERTMIPNGRNGHESVLSLPGPMWNEAFRDLDRCLERMRLRAAHDEIAFVDEKGLPGRCSRRCARWHVCAWYIDQSHTQKIVRRSVSRKNGKQGHVLVPALVPQRQPGARRGIADGGVSWIVGQFGWESGLVQEALATLSKEPAGLRLAA